MLIKKLHEWFNIIGLFLLSVLLCSTFYVQIAFHHLPCPLCLLQRLGFAGVGIAIICNLAIEIKARHYGLMLLSALFGFGSALRHMFLHITPNDPGFGPPIFGLHLYVWSAMIFGLILVLGALALVFESGFHKVKNTFITKTVMWLFMLLIAANALSSLLECGVGQCPANPETYLLLTW